MYQKMLAKRLYLGCGDCGTYELGTRKKDWTPSEGFDVCAGDYLIGFCAEPFEAFTGIKLKPGEIRRVKSITIELE